MNAIEQCTLETIEVALPDRRSKKVTAHRHLDWAVHRGITQSTSHEWRITHLPTGTMIATGFGAADIACDAMVEIARLRNDWAVFWKGDSTPELKTKVDEIVQKRFGYIPTSANAGQWDRRLNGYDSVA